MSQNTSRTCSSLTPWIKTLRNPSDNLTTCKYPPGLYIISTPIGNLEDITIRALNTLAFSDVVVCEDTRQTQKLLSHYGIKKKLISYFDHNDDRVRPKILHLLEEGLYVALVSDAGTPLISDPGYKLIKDVVAAGHYVTAVPGPSSILTGLVISGQPCDRFFFEGFLPPKITARRKRLNDLRDIPGTLIFFETANRLIDTLKDMQECLGDRPATLARELTKKFENCYRGTLTSLYDNFKNPDTFLKGECVLIVSATNTLKDSHYTQDIESLLRLLLKDHSLKEAVDHVHEITGSSKKDIYKKALGLKDQHS